MLRSHSLTHVYCSHSLKHVYCSYSLKHVFCSHSLKHVFRSYSLKHLYCSYSLTHVFLASDDDAAVEAFGYLRAVSERRELVSESDISRRHWLCWRPDPLTCCQACRVAFPCSTL